MTTARQQFIHSLAFGLVLHDISLFQISQLLIPCIISTYSIYYHQNRIVVRLMSSCRTEASHRKRCVSALAMHYHTQNHFDSSSAILIFQTYSFGGLLLAWPLLFSPFDSLSFLLSSRSPSFDEDCSSFARDLESSSR